MKRNNPFANEVAACLGETVEFTSHLEKLVKKKLGRFRTVIAAADRRKVPVYSFEYGDPTAPGYGLLRVSSVKHFDGRTQYRLTKMNRMRSDDGVDRRPYEGVSRYFSKEARDDLFSALLGRLMMLEGDLKVTRANVTREFYELKGE